MIKAAIFDLDGTLVDSNELHVEAWEKTFQHFGMSFPRTKLREHIGKGADQYLPEFLSKEELDRLADKITRYRADIYKADYLPRVTGFPAVADLFEMLRAEGKQIALATSGKGDELRHYMKLLKIEELVDAFTSADDAEKSKPFPDIFQAALHRLNDVAPAEALVVGDTRFDVEAAGRTGAAAVAVLCGGSDESALRSAGAVAVYRDPADLLARYRSSPFHVERAA